MLGDVEAHAKIAKLEAEIARLEAQLELAQTFGSKRERALRAALERIETMTGNIHQKSEAVALCFAIARKALAKEGKMSEDISLTCCPGCDREAALKSDIARLLVQHRMRLSNLQMTNDKLRAVLEEVYQSIKPLLPDGWSDAGYVMNVIAKALAKEGK